MATDFKLPELGENIAAGDVLRVLVSPGDTIARDQSVLELETDKATIEVPSSVAGRVTDVKVKAGEKVKVGQVILTVDEAEAGAPASGAKAEPKAPEQPAPREAGVAAATEQPAAGPKPAAPRAEQPAAAASAQRPATAERPGEDEEEQESATEPPSRSRRGEVVDISRVARPVSAESMRPAREAQAPAPAAPSVRRLARELGVDIHDVPGSGLGGRISQDDVKAFAKRLITEGAGGFVRAEPLPDFSRWGRVERKPMSNIRRRTAERLSAAWATVPQVTQHDRADITRLEELRKQMAKKAEAAGGSLTLTAIAVKVIASALKVFPQFNSSVDMARHDIVYKSYRHVGVAVDTDRGLLVPVMRDADTKNIIELSVELTRLAEKARTRKLTIEEMEGGSFTISNLGGIGGTAFSPIVNAPEVAILGISRGSLQPVWVKDQFVPRLVLPLSLSYDHRVIDGADAIRFLRWVAEALEQPFLLSLEG